MTWFRGKLSLFLITVQGIFIVIFGVLVDFGSVNTSITRPPNDPPKYSMIQDVHVMIFIGFGFLMTFLKKYGFSSVSFNLLTASLGIQWAMIIRGLLHSFDSQTKTILIDYSSMMTGDFAVATCLISFGAVLGKTSPLQILVMMLLEIVFAQVNEYIGLDKLYAVDIGESMYLHTFGAYFGLAVARVLHKEDIEDNPKEGSVYNSDLFAMVGTVFLWIFWPSFNSAGAATAEAQQRAVLNTLLSLCACTTMVFTFSTLFDKKGKLDMVHIQNSTIAGGVAVGACADTLTAPWVSLLVGSLVGILSVAGFKYLSPLMSKYTKIHDTCGVHNLHGMPGVFAGIVAALVAYTVTDDTYKNIPIDTFYPARNNATENRTGFQQGAYQIAALAVTIAFAFVSGIFTGLVLKLPIWNEPKDDELYDDCQNWLLPEEEEKKEMMNGKSFASSVQSVPEKPEEDTQTTRI